MDVTEYLLCWKAAYMEPQCDAPCVGFAEINGLRS